MSLHFLLVINMLSAKDDVWVRSTSWPSRKITVLGRYLCSKFLPFVLSSCAWNLKKVKNYATFLYESLFHWSKTVIPTLESQNWNHHELTPLHHEVYIRYSTRNISLSLNPTEQRPWCLLFLQLPSLISLSSRVTCHPMTVIQIPTSII